MFPPYRTTAIRSSLVWVLHAADGSGAAPFFGTDTANGPIAGPSGRAPVNLFSACLRTAPSLLPKLDVEGLSPFARANRTRIGGITNAPTTDTRVAAKGAIA
jgi:hypothetical protein